MIKSASSIANSVCVFIFLWIFSFLIESIPPESIRVNCFPFHSHSAYILSLVIPGSLSTIAIFFLVILLNKVDFPTFILPIMATTGFPEIDIPTP